MPKENSDVKIIPSLKGQGPAVKMPFNLKKYLCLGLFFLCFLILLLSVSYLPLAYSLKVIALFLGSFLIEDLHRTAKGRYF